MRPIDARQSEHEIKDVRQYQFGAEHRAAYTSIFVFLVTSFVFVIAIAL